MLRLLLVLPLVYCLFDFGNPVLNLCWQLELLYQLLHLFHHLQTHL
jgi:hypothetical protein